MAGPNREAAECTPAAPVRILVDARHLRSGGIGRFLRGVAGPWIGAGAAEGAEAADGVEEVRLLGPANALRRWLDEVAPEAVTGGRASVVPWDDPMYSIRAQARWVLRLGSSFEGCDVAFFPHYDVPLLRHPSPSVVTVHDLTQFLLPEHYPRRKRWAGRRLLRGAVKRAERIVTVSEPSRSDIVEHLDVDGGRITVVPDGVDAVFRPLDAAERERALGRWGSLRPFLLLVGPDRPHKNLAHAVDTLARLLPEHPDLRLVRVGAPGPGPGEERAAERGLSDRWASLGAVDDAELRELYALADGLLFPSLREGFGLPPFEAAACGTPAVAGPQAVPLTLAAEVGVRVEPLEVDAWTGAVSGMLQGDGLRPSPDRVPRWDASSERLLEVLKGTRAKRPAERP